MMLTRADPEQGKRKPRPGAALLTGQKPGGKVRLQLMCRTGIRTDRKTFFFKYHYVGDHIFIKSNIQGRLVVGRRFTRRYHLSSMGIAKDCTVHVKSKLLGIALVSRVVPNMNLVPIINTIYALHHRPIRT